MDTHHSRTGPLTRPASALPYDNQRNRACLITRGTRMSPLRTARDGRVPTKQISPVLTERDGAVLTVRINNPPFNFLTTAIMCELEETFSALERDRTIRAVVLTSAVPDLFINQYDIAELVASADKVGLAVSPGLATLILRTLSPLYRISGVRGALERTPASGIMSLLRFHRFVQRMLGSDMVFVAAINGPALGGGCELALACDIRIAADGPYQLGQPEVLFGLLPGGGGSQLLARSLGAARTIELTLEGRLFTPREAFEAGLVQHLVEPATLLGRAQETAARLARRSPATVRAVKRAVYRGGSARLAQGFALERANFLALASNPGTKAAMRRYLDQIREQQGSDQQPSDFVRQRLPAWQAGTVTDFPG